MPRQNVGWPGVKTGAINDSPNKQMSRDTNKVLIAPIEATRMLEKFPTPGARQGLV